MMGEKKTPRALACFCAQNNYIFNWKEANANFPFIILHSYSYIILGAFFHQLVNGAPIKLIDSMKNMKAAWFINFGCVFVVREREREMKRSDEQKKNLNTNKQFVNKRALNWCHADDEYPNM